MAPERRGGCARRVAARAAEGGWADTEGAWHAQWAALARMLDVTGLFCVSAMCAEGRAYVRRNDPCLPCETKAVSMALTRVSAPPRGACIVSILLGFCIYASVRSMKSLVFSER